MGDTDFGQSYQDRRKLRGQEHILENRSYGQAFHHFEALCKSSDIIILNYEGPFVNPYIASPYKDIKEYIHYTDHNAGGPVLKDLGIDMVSLANNHSLDFGLPYLYKSIDHFNELGISSIGAGAKRD